MTKFMSRCPYHPAEPIEIDRPDYREFACGRNQDTEGFTAGAHKRGAAYFRDRMNDH